MRVLVAGASGAIGTRLVPQLIDAGHEVIGTTTSSKGAERVRALGAKPIALDLLDARAVRQAVLASEPEAIVHEATALAEARFTRNLDRSFVQTNRLRTEGTDNLLAAAREAGVRRFVAQSVATFGRYLREGGPVKTEDDPLDTTPVAGMQETGAALRHLEEAVTEAGGIALRYGAFYGASNDGLVDPVRKRQFPIVGDGGGFFSWIQLDDAAAATVLALEHDGPAIYNIVDDEPAPVREWLPVLADALGAKPPRRFPRWLARLFAGEVGVMMGTEARGASNAKAKRELGWELRYPSWREGFAPPTRRPRRRLRASRIARPDRGTHRAKRLPARRGRNRPDRGTGRPDGRDRLPPPERHPACSGLDVDDSPREEKGSPASTPSPKHAARISLSPVSWSAPLELRLTLLDERTYRFAGVVGCAQNPDRLLLQIQRRGEVRLERLLGHPLMRNHRQR